MLIPVILSGGSGTRLWPVSRSAYPKPFMRMGDNESLLYKTLERALRLEAEERALTQELAGALGLGGRDRVSGSAAERARVSVTRAIRAALARIREHSPALGAHLDATIRTGTFCAYMPDPRAPIVWRT